MKFVKKLFFIVAALVLLAVSASASSLKTSKKALQDEVVLPNPLAFPIPKLSKALGEFDPNRKITKTTFKDLVKNSLFQMTQGEVEQVFVFADANKDDLIDFKEWYKFKALYVIPFEGCDSDHNNLLSKDEFKACFDADPKTKLIEFLKRYADKKHEILLSIISSRKDLSINFADYIFIRKAMFAWKECQSSTTYIAKAHFRCGLQFTVPYHLKITYDKIYDIGIRLSNDISLTRLDFVSFVRILYDVYVFSVFAAPRNNNPYIERTQFIKAIREDRLPNLFEESEVNYFYDLISSNPLHKTGEMNFETFAFFFNFYKLFNKYSKEDPIRISEAELLELLKDELTPLSFLNAIDACLGNFTPEELSEASLSLQRQRIDERDFFYSFKQITTFYPHKSEIVSEETDFPRYMLPHKVDKPNDAARKLFFSAMVEVQKTHWTKFIYYRAFQLTNLFVALTSDHRYIVSTETLREKINAFYDLVNPTINYAERKNYILFKSVPREVYLDLITFLQVQEYPNKIRMTKISSSNTIYETLLKVVMKDFGITNLSDNVIDVALIGYDKLKRRTYNALEVLKILITVHSIAAERRRTADTYKERGLKPNKAAWRPYPMPNRRLKDSSMV